MNNTYRLQLRHGAEDRNFGTRGELLDYINGQIGYGGVSLLPYEPVLFYYGEEDEKNAVILVGLPEKQTKGGKKYFLVDTADLKEQIAEINGKYDAEIGALKEEDTKIWEAVNKEIADRIAADEAEAEIRAEKDSELEQAIADESEAREKADEELQKAIDFTKDDLVSVIEACGLLYNANLATDRVSYEPDMHDEIIRDSKDIADAIDKVSKFVAKLAEDIKLAVEDTDTVKLHLNSNDRDGGNVLSADVNIAGVDGLSKRTFDNNILGKTSDGLYVSASIEQSATNPNMLVFKTSGYVDGQFKVDAFETEVPLASYTGDNGKNTGVSVSVDEDKNIISAELNLSSDKSNILKLEDGEYIVEGLAKNIKYKDTTVNVALNDQSKRLDDIEDAIEFVKGVDVKGDETDSTVVTVEKTTKGDFHVSTDVKLSNDKSIVVANGGLKADVSATFKKGTSTLVINVGKNEYAIDLSDLSASVLKGATYDAGTEDLVLEFIVGNTTNTVRVPVGTLIHDVEVDDTDTIDMTLRGVSGGPNHISAELRVDKAHSDNILTVNSNGAYVSKGHITDAVKIESDSRKEADAELKTKLDKLSTIAESNKDAIDAEVTRAKAAEAANATAIANEITRAKNAEEANATLIDKNDKAIKDIKNAIDEEIARAMKAEQNNKTAIDAEVKRAQLVEAKNANDISNEIDRATEKEADLLEKIGANTSKIKDVEKAVADEITRATKAENELNTTVNANAVAIEAEAARATAAEAANMTAITAESNRAKTAEGEISATVKDNKDKINNVTNAVNSLTTNLENEVIRAKAEEKSNSDAIKNEADRAIEKEADLLEKINKNATEIQSLSSEIGDIELRKVGDLSYALYVNGTKHGEFIIPKDQFLKSVTYEPTTKELVFVFNTSADETTTRISIADLIDTYTAGDGLKLTGNAFSVDFNVVASVDTVTSAVNEEKLRATAAETINENAISAETVRATSAENDLKTLITSNKTEIDANRDAINTEVTRATAAEGTNATAITNEIARATAAEAANKTLVENEVNRATTAEANLTTKIAEQKTSIDKVASDLVKQSEKCTNELKEAKKEISDAMADKANSVDVYTKDEILEKLADYAKTEDVQSKLDEKLNVTDAQNVYATKEALQAVKDTYATIEYVGNLNKQLDARVEGNENAIDNFNLTYNAATSELVYTDKNGTAYTYKLYSGSLIKKGEFDSKSNSIVLTIENAGQESQIIIPVSELLSDLSEKIKDNETAIQKINEALAKLAKDWEVQNTQTVELTKSTVGEKDTLSAIVKISSSNKQAIQATNNGLYVSNDLEDYTCVFGAEGTISAQNAVSKLLETTTTIKNDFNNRITDNKNEIDRLKVDVKKNTNDIASLNTEVQTNKANISTLKENVINNTSEITNLKERVSKVEDRVTATEGRIITLETKVDNLTTRLTTVEGEITTIKNTITNHDTKFNELETKIEDIKKLIKEVNDGDVSTLLDEIEKIKKVTAYDKYNNPKDMSVRLDKIEENVGENVKEEINKIKNNMIGPKDGSVEGSIWQEINNMVDAGTF